MREPTPRRIDGGTLLRPEGDFAEGRLLDREEERACREARLATYCVLSALAAAYFLVAVVVFLIVGPRVGRLWWADWIPVDWRVLAFGGSLLAVLASLLAVYFGSQSMTPRNSHRSLAMAGTITGAVVFLFGWILLQVVAGRLF